VKIAIGLSGGVDSSVAASLLIRSGAQAVGIYLDAGTGGAELAASAAHELGIELIVTDIRDSLENLVCQPFEGSYLEGRTPNPCIICNPAVKFPAILRAAKENGCERIATGHYSRVCLYRDSYHIYKGCSENDQSYMLCGLNQDILKQLVLPLGDYSKSQVRSLAASFSLSSATTPDSMDICFIPDKNYAAWLQARGASAPSGDFLDDFGNIIGSHKGIHRYTLGQRRGLGVSKGNRLYVSNIDVCTNTITLSSGEAFSTTQARTLSPFWTSGIVPELPARFSVKTRHSKSEVMSSVSSTNEGLLIDFDLPIRPPAPGQTAVFYDADRLVGCAEIR